MTELNVKHLSPQERGSVIRALRRVTRKRPGRAYWIRDRVFTDDQIRRALGLTRRQVAEALQAGEMPYWNRQSAAEAVLSFALKHKRWPGGREFSHRPRENDLPSWGAISRHMQGYQYQSGNHWGHPVEACIDYLVTRGDYWPKLTPQLILAIPNVTIRRRAMEKYGVEKLLADGGGTAIQQDDYGKLWRMPSDNRRDAHAQWVEVTNSTPEPDGTYAHYFLRVPPTVTTAHEGVARSFGRTPDEYKVLVET